MEKKIFVLPICLTLLISCGGNNPTPQNDPDPTENSAFLSGEGAPSNTIGNQYDHYLDIATRYVYEKNDGVWYNKFSIGSNVLLDVQTSCRRSRAGDNQEIKTALINTFYSTNISFSYYLNGGGTSTLTKMLDFSIYKEEAIATSYIGGNPTAFYFRVNNGNDQYYCPSMGEGYVDIDNPNLYCSFPFPSLECIPNNYYGIQDKDLGGFTALIIANLDNAQYEENTDTYSISHITASHDGIDYKGYVVEAGNSDFSVSFKLSEDKNYIAELEATIHSSCIGGRDNDVFKMEFTRYHSSNIA